MDMFKKLKNQLNDDKKNDEAETLLWTHDRAVYEDSPDFKKLAISESSELDDAGKKDYPLPQGMAAGYFTGESSATGAEFATGLGDDRDVNEQVPVGQPQPFNPLEALPGALGKLTTKDSFKLDKAASGEPGFNYPVSGVSQSYHDNDADYRYNEPHIPGAFPHRTAVERHDSGPDSDSNSDSNSNSDKSSRESFEEGQKRYAGSNDYRGVDGQSDSPTGQYSDHPEREYEQDVIDQIQSPESCEDDDGFLDQLRHEGRERIIREIDERLGETGGDLVEEFFVGRKDEDKC